MNINDYTPPGPKIFERKTNDFEKGDDLQSARDIGRLRLERSRLNLFSALGADDKEDNFKFTIDSNGNTRLGLLNMSDEDDVRFQIYNKRGRIIADSKDSTGALFERYERLRADDGEKLEKGEYSIKVSRMAGPKATTEHNYGFQLSMGGFVEDYETIEYKAEPGSEATSTITVPASLLASQGMNTMLSDGLSRLNNILSGALNTLFPPSQ